MKTGNIPPYYENRKDGMSCALAVYRSIIEHFTGKVLTWDELEQLTGYKNGIAAWTIKALTELSNDGWDIKMVEPFNYERYYNEGLSYLPEVFTGTEMNWQLKNSNITEMKKYIPVFLRTIDHDIKNPTAEDIDAMLDQGRLVSLVLNSKALNNKAGYTSHNVLVYDHDKDNYMFHDPGLPGRQARIELKSHVLKAMGNASDATGFKLLQ